MPLRKTKKSVENSKAAKVQKWFKEKVTCDGEPYTIDLEQAEAVADGSRNAIVVARAGSGKTRTIVAKIVYLVAKLGVKPDEIMVFVFNANAAAEINARLTKMRVDGEQIMKNARIASTFHAFSRKVVYEICDGREKCGKILAGEKEDFVLEIVQRMLCEEKWREKIRCFIKGAESDERGGENLEDDEVVKFAKMMTQFINRAQQKYLGGEENLRKVAKRYLQDADIGARERIFINIGVECFVRYHWYLLNEDGRRWLKRFKDYGTDFNLVVSWASKLIGSGREEILDLLSGKKYILIDEYQDFSQLFLAAVLAIREVASEAKLFVVGDDWQAINRFAGSDVEYFKEFEKFFPDNTKRLAITTNYRCDYEIVDAARHFMKKAMGEKGDFRAFSRRAGKVVLVDPSETELGYGLVDYDRRVKLEDKEYKNLVRRAISRVPKKATVQYFKTVAEMIRQNKGREILILHRNNETNIEGISLEKFAVGLRMVVRHFKIMDGDEFDKSVKFMTMHKSKGLEAEVVIILEVDEGVIPKMHPDTILYSMFGETEEVALDDQKRLFYVAMTRAKKRLYIIHNKRDGAGFAKYLKNLEKRC